MQLANYLSLVEKSPTESAVQSKASYDKDPESGIKSAARSKACYDKDVEKSRTESAARSKANYEKDIEANRTLKRQRYVILYTLYNKTFERENLHGFFTNQKCCTIEKVPAS